MASGWCTRILARQFGIALAHSAIKPTFVSGCLGIFDYLSGLRIVDSFGLVDAHVAHQPLAERGRPGHEKLISLAYALSSGGDIADGMLWPAGYEPYVKTRVGVHDHSFLLSHRPG
jgi:hypothetical protein